jgi:magnesium chelatase family protein
LGILAASGVIDGSKFHGHEFAGELSLSGQLRPVHGALAMALGMALDETGDCTKPPVLVLPAGSAEEASLVPHAHVVRVEHLLDVVSRFRLPSNEESSSVAVDSEWTTLQAPERKPQMAQGNLNEVRGQQAAKRALEIAAAGGHSVLMVGAPGTGKSMLAQRFSSILPPMNTQEALESAAVLSLAGQFKPERWAQRVVQSPHHTASAVALVGGGCGLHELT